jgi:hypothetical protein
MYVSQPPRTFAAVVLVLLLAGCDGRDMTAPTDSHSHRTALDTELSGQLWYSFLSPPGTSSPADVEGITPQQIASIPAATWVVINVSGEIQHRWNDQCAFAPPNWPCLPGSVIQPFGLLPSTSGPVKLWAGAGPLSMRGLSDNSAIGLHYLTNAGSLSGQINMQAKWAWDPNFGNGTFSYYLSGGYSVDAVAVASPIGLVDSGELDSTGVHQYTVQPLYGLELINPRDWSWTWPAGAVRWTFIQGDSISPTAGALGGRAWGIPACDFKTTCHYTPPGPGRMEVETYVEGQYVGLRSEMVEIARPATCPLRLRGGLPGWLLGYPHAGSTWTAEWNRAEVLDSVEFDRARYIPHEYGGYTAGKGNFVVSRDGAARWYEPRLELICFAITSYNRFGGIEYVEERYKVIKHFGEVVPNSGQD